MIDYTNYCSHYCMGDGIGSLVRKLYIPERKLYSIHTWSQSCFHNVLCVIRKTPFQMYKWFPPISLAYTILIFGRLPLSKRIKISPDHLRFYWVFVIRLRQNGRSGSWLDRSRSQVIIFRNFFFLYFSNLKYQRSFWNKNKFFDFCLLTW